MSPRSVKGFWCEDREGWRKYAIFTKARAEVLEINEDWTILKGILRPTPTYKHYPDIGASQSFVLETKA